MSITTTLGTPKLWPLLTGGHCSEVPLCSKCLKWDAKIVVVKDWWSLFGDGRQLKLGCMYIKKLTYKYFVYRKSIS